MRRPNNPRLAVNPRTLDLLGPTGVTQRMLEIGLPVHGVRFYRNDRNVASLSLAGIHPKYPYMLALSQATSERLLAEALQAAGGKVERRNEVGQLPRLGNRSRGRNCAEQRGRR